MLRSTLNVFVLLWTVNSLLANVVREISEQKLPETLTVCHRSDPALKTCIEAAIETLRPLLKDGVPEMNIPQCEPLAIPQMMINQGNGPISLQSTYSNIQVTGVTSFQITNVSLDLDNDRVRVDLKIPHLHTTSNYSMTGQILILPIVGDGFCQSNYTDINATCEIQANRFQKNNITYWNVQDIFLDFNIGNAEIQINDLFNGDEELGKTMNVFLNENWRSVADEIKPTLEATIGDMFKEITNRVFHKYPFDQLLPL